MSDDARPINATVTSTDLAVNLEFSESIKWLAMPKVAAIQMAIQILQHCGVTVTATVTPGQVELIEPPKQEPV